MQKILRIIDRIKQFIFVGSNFAISLSGSENHNNETKNEFGA